MLDEKLPAAAGSPPDTLSSRIWMASLDPKNSRRNEE